MRGYDAPGVGMHSGSNKQLGAGDRRPSKLELMRDDYHKKLLREKEEKMVQLFEDSKASQRQAMMRVMARNGSGGRDGSAGGGMGNANPTNNGSSSVRDFFNERRRMEANGMPVPPIDNHYRQSKGYNSPGGWSSRTGSGNSVKKISAGRDRSQPLAPIRRPEDTSDRGRNGQTKATYANGSDRLTPRENFADNNPFKARPQMVKHKPLPATNRVDGNNNEDRAGLPPKYGYQAKMHQQRQQQQQQQQQKQQQQKQFQQQQQQKQQQQQQSQRQWQQPPSQQRTAPKPKQADGRKGESKMTDFQKWQLEQNKSREDRLKRLNTQNNVANGHQEDQDWGQYNNGGYSNRSRQSNARYDDESEEENHEEEEEEENVYESEASRLERELMEKISREQAHLKRIQMEREREEQQEAAEREARQKKEAVERAKQKKMEEQRRKEEERRRKEEEEEYKREKAREEKQRREEEKHRKDMDKRRKEEEKLALKRQQEEERRLAKLQKQSMKSSRQSSVQSGHYDESPLPSARRSPPIPTSSRQTAADMVDFDDQPVAGSDSSYYAKMAKSSEAKASVGSLAKCRVCGRSFAQDRLKKHQDACKSVSKPRKVFDVKKHRLEGTDAAKYIGKSKRPEPKKKSNWRAKHNEFIESLRYAKKAAQIEKEGGDIRNLTPPPATKNPDLVPCPYCGRTFNETAAERHIPRCKDLKTKPAPMNTRRR